jgi:hypothetical protein
MKTANPKPHPKKPASYWKTVFQVTPLPMFIVDRDVRIEDFNPAAGELLKDDRSKVLRRRGGEALHCVHATESPEGCGHSSHCKACMIRNSVTAATRGDATHRGQAKMELVQDGRTSRIQLLVTTTPLHIPHRQLVLLILENITELLTLHGLLAVCAYCKKIRDDQQNWQQIDAYFTERLDINFSHGVCPDCMKKFFEEFDRHEPSPQ